MQVLFQALLLAGYLIAAYVPIQSRRYLPALAGVAVLAAAFVPTSASRTMSPLEAVVTVAWSLGPGFIFLCTTTITAVRYLGGSRENVAWLYAVSNIGALRPSPRTQSRSSHTCRSTRSFKRGAC
jgi:hypothetical protein